MDGDTLQCIKQLHQSFWDCLFPLHLHYVSTYLIFCAIHCRHLNGIYLLQHKLEPCNIFITLALRIPADISYSRDGNSKLELFLSPEDTFQMMQLLTSEDDRLKFQQDSLHQKHQQKVSSAALIHTPFIYLNQFKIFRS